MKKLKNATGGFMSLSDGENAMHVRIIVGADPDPNREADSATAEHYIEFDEAVDRFKALKADHPQTCMRMLSGDEALEIPDHWEVDRDHLAMTERQQCSKVKELTYATLRMGGLSKEESCQLSGLGAIPIRGR
jgi:hypothetical protein